MAYTGLYVFKDNLKQLIHGNHDLVINNNPMILSETPQLHLLYQELASIIQTFFEIHQHHHPYDLQEIENLKRRFKYAAEEAQDIIDLFLSTVHFRKRGLSPRSDVFKTFLDLDKVLKYIESIKLELMAINISNMKMDSSSRMDHVKTRSVAAAAGTSYTRNPSETKKPSEDIVVGLDHDIQIIRDKLTEDTKKLCIVSIVGIYWRILFLAIYLTIFWSAPFAILLGILVIISLSCCSFLFLSLFVLYMYLDFL